MRIATSWGPSLSDPAILFALCRQRNMKLPGEILQLQDDQLKKLIKRYAVVEMTRNPDGVKIH